MIYVPASTETRSSSPSVAEVKPVTSGAGRRVCILVLGMHRSGTSALTRVLNLMGAALPKNVVGATEWNAAGHWEPELLGQLHTAMLDECGSRWDDWQKFDFNYLGKERQKYYKTRMSELIIDQYNQSEIFVIKDPRICRFVDIYQEILSAEKIDVRYIMMLRDPFQVIKSLSERDKLEYGFSARLWLRHVLDAEAATRGLPRSRIWFDDLINDPSAEVTRLTRELRVAWPNESLGGAKAAESLSPGLIHHEDVRPWSIPGVGETLSAVAMAMRSADTLKHETLSTLELARAKLGQHRSLDKSPTSSPNSVPDAVEGAEMEHEGRDLMPSAEQPTASNEQKIRTSADIYVFDVDPKSDTAAAAVLRFVGSNKDVLEIGAGPGSIARPLVNRNGCRVTAFEADLNCIPILRQFCSEVYQGDLNSPSWHEPFADQSFDAIVIADVLEHLVDPWATLRAVRRLLRPGGAVISSIPNSSHSAMMASLLNEDVDYREWGLLDRTHIRFFGIKNLQPLFRQAGLKIVDANFVTKAPEETEFAAVWHQTAASVRLALEGRPFSQVYQTVVMALDEASVLPAPEISLLDRPPPKQTAPLLEQHPATSHAALVARRAIGKALGPRGRSLVKRLLGMPQ